MLHEFNLFTCLTQGEKSVGNGCATSAIF